MSQVSEAHEGQLLRSLYEEDLVSVYLEDDSGEEKDSLEDAQDADELEVVLESEYEWSEPVSERSYNGLMDFVLHALTDLYSEYLGGKGEICLDPSNEYPDGFATKDQLKPRDFRHLVKKYPGAEFGDQDFSDDNKNLSKKLRILSQHAGRGDQKVFPEGLAEGEINEAIEKMEVSGNWIDTNL
ncbi:hypothetical protein [Candidatus Nanohalobium constans]|uniref:Uncharacterized protein n=1 Tax=Candidatus Nanohalobium constans TaxID=2565781 RepID=A0A5Q0UG60_9ARCH|nr:hypothetical protein [Candidatus Nanohalobium constans]QGA80576.1 hypothetical protein LC1Nh_0687 [Candidatus Nanohalobium constans]